MDEEERKKKIEAGKQKLANFVKKKNKSDKSRKSASRTTEISSFDLSEDAIINLTTDDILQYETEDCSHCLLNLPSTMHGHIDRELTEEEAEILEAEKGILSKVGTNLQGIPSVDDDFLPQENVSMSCFTGNIDECKRLAEDKFELLAKEYKQKIQKFQEALYDRDRIISQLSDRLASTLQMRHAVQDEATVQAETLAREINMLKLQLQQATEVLGRQKSQNGISAQELLEARNQVIFLEEGGRQKDEIINNLTKKVLEIKGEMELLKEELNLTETSVKSTFEDTELNNDELSCIKSEIMGINEEISEASKQEVLLEKTGDIGEENGISDRHELSLQQTTVVGAGDSAGPDVSRLEKSMQLIPEGVENMIYQAGDLCSEQCLEKQQGIQMPKPIEGFSKAQKGTEIDISHMGCFFCAGTESSNSLGQEDNLQELLEVIQNNPNSSVCDNMHLNYHLQCILHERSKLYETIEKLTQKISQSKELEQTDDIFQNLETNLVQRESTEGSNKEFNVSDDTQKKLENLPERVLRRLSCINSVIQMLGTLLNLARREILKVPKVGLLSRDFKHLSKPINLKGDMASNISENSAELVEQESARINITSVDTKNVVSRAQNTTNISFKEPESFKVTSKNDKNVQSTLHEDLSPEYLRSHEVCERLSHIGSFFQEELNTCFSVLENSFDSSTADCSELVKLEYKVKNIENTANVNVGLIECKETEIPVIDSHASASECDENSKKIYKDIAFQKKRLECNLLHLRNMEENLRKVIHEQIKESERENTAEVEDLISDELPLSSISLVSFTDSEYKNEGSEVEEVNNENKDANEFSVTKDVLTESIEEPRRVQTREQFNVQDLSLDKKIVLMNDKQNKLSPAMPQVAFEAGSSKEIPSIPSQIEGIDFSRMKSNEIQQHEMDKEENIKNQQDKRFVEEKQLLCSQYEESIQQLKERHSQEIQVIKEALENQYNIYKTEILEKTCDFQVHEAEMENRLQRLETKFLEEKKICSEHIIQVLQLIGRHSQEFLNIKDALEKQFIREKNEMLIEIKELKDKLVVSNRKFTECLEAKAETEINLQNQIADLVQDHEQDLKTLKQNFQDSLIQEKKKNEVEYSSYFDNLKMMYEEQLNNVNENMKMNFEEEKKEINEEHCRILEQLSSKQKEEIRCYETKVDALLEEKCSLLAKHDNELKIVAKKTQKALKELSLHLQLKVSEEKEKLQCGISGTEDHSLEVVYADALEGVCKRMQNEVEVFFTDKILGSLFKDTENLGNIQKDDLQLRHIVSNMEHEKQVKEMEEKISRMREDHNAEIQNLKMQYAADMEEAKKLENYSDAEEIQSSVLAEMDKLQQDFEKEMGVYRETNEQLAQELQLVRNQLLMLEEHKADLEKQLQKEKEFKDISEVHRMELDSSSVSHAAQTNSRLLHVLSDLVKTFLDIEHDIHSHLQQYGLASQLSDIANQHDDDTGQSVGSREDFTAMSVGESPNLDLTEDGPDLTPRAWDLFTSMGTYDADTEGEDVVLGASRRLRIAVEHVLHLLAHAVDNQHNQDLKLLLKRNEELSQDLHEECHSKDTLQMDLVKAESLIRKLDVEKQRLEDINSNLQEDNESLLKELEFSKDRLRQLEESKEEVYEEQLQLQEQRDLLAKGLGEPEQRLLQENTKLSTEKRNIQQHHTKERKSLLSRLHQLELALEEVTAQKEDILEKRRIEVDDLKSQMEAMEKQLQSNKKFIEEQTLEREQEREDYFRELRKLEEIVREKEKIQNSEDQLTKEVESLEQQLKAKIEDHRVVLVKREELERDLRQSVDKIHDLRDIIGELEKQLDLKLRTETDLKQQLANIWESLSVHEKSNVDAKNEFDDHTSLLMSRDAAEQLRELQEQLASRTQEVEQLSQSQILLQELRGQIHFLEAKVEQKTRQLEAMHLVSLSTSPVPSDDTSHSESQDGELQHVSVEDGWEMSPRSLHWLEIRRLEEKLGRLTHIEEELFKRNKDLDAHFRKLKTAEEELNHENAALQKQVTDQLLQISALKSRIEEQRHRSSVSVNTEFKVEFEELKESLLREQEQKKLLDQELLDIKEQLKEAQKELESRNKTIQKLNREIEKTENSSPVSEIQGNAHQKMEENKLHSSNEVENVCLPHCIQMLIQEKNDQIDSLTTQLQYFLDEKGMNVNQLTLTLEEVKHEVELKELELSNIRKEKTDLYSHIKQLEGSLLESNNKVTQLTSSISELENEVKDGKEKLELEQVKVETLLQEKKLQNDFDTVQDMMQKKEKELATLQEETEIQLRLEAELETLHQMLADERSIKEELELKVQELQETLEYSNNAHATEANKWHLQLDEITKNHVANQEDLKMQLHLLHQQLSISLQDKKFNLEEAKENIVNAAECLKDQGEKAKETFQQIVLHVLQQAVSVEVKQLQSSHQKEIQNINKSWQEKINEEKTSHEMVIQENKSKYDIRCHEHENEKLLWEKKHKEELESFKLTMACKLKELKEGLLSDKEKYWQDKLRQMEWSLKEDQECVKKLLTAELQIQEQVSSKVEEVRKALQETHFKEILELKETLEKLCKEKELLTLMHKQEMENIKCSLRTLYEKEKCNVVEECKTKLSLQEEKLKNDFTSQKQQLENVYHNQIQELQKALNSKLNEEREQLQTRHKDELKTLHNFFTKHWEEELVKLHKLRQEEFEHLKQCKDKTVDDICNQLFSVYDDKLKNIQMECEKQIAHERKEAFSTHQVELQKLQQILEEKFQNEKQNILLTKEEQMRIVKEELEKKYDKEMLQKLESRELQLLSEKMMTLEENLKKKWENEKRKMQMLHQTEINSLKQNLQIKFDKQQKSLLRAHQSELKQVENVYRQELENAREHLKEAKTAVIKSDGNDVLLVRSDTPSSEMSTSSGHTSSSYRDMVPTNIQVVIDKIDRAGIQVLSLTEREILLRHLTPCLDDPNNWLNERQWIISKLKCLSSDMSDAQCEDLKHTVNIVVQEVQLMRKKLESSKIQEASLQEQVTQLQWQLNTQREIIEFHANQEKALFNDLQASLNNEKSYSRELLSQLMQQQKHNLKLKAVLASKDAKLPNIQKKGSCSEQLHPEKATSNEQILIENIANENTSALSTTEEVEYLRSADIHKSADKYSVYYADPVDPLAEIPHTVNTVQLMECAKCASAESALLVERSSWAAQRALLQDSVQEAQNESSHLRHQLHQMKIERNRGFCTASEAKLHHMYWKYRRSESYQKALIFQKKYLLTLLGGFQATEEVTLAMLAQMGANVSKKKELLSSNSSMINQQLRGCSLFRSVSYVIIGTIRMKFLVKHWKRAARVPPSHIIAKEVESAVKKVSVVTPSIKSDSQNTSSCSSPLRLSGSPYTDDYISENPMRSRDVTLRNGLEVKIPLEAETSTSEQGHLIEYVTRLETLHRQLGLNIQDKS